MIPHSGGQRFDPAYLHQKADFQLESRPQIVEKAQQSWAFSFFCAMVCYLCAFSVPAGIYSKPLLRLMRNRGFFYSLSPELLRAFSHDKHMAFLVGIFTFQHQPTDYPFLSPPLSEVSLTGIVHAIVLLSCFPRLCFPFFSWYLTNIGITHHPSRSFLARLRTIFSMSFSRSGGRLYRECRLNRKVSRWRRAARCSSVMTFFAVSKKSS